jgi:hypothetical protein
MIDRRVPGRPASEAMFVTPTEVAAAKAILKLAEQWGEQVDNPAVHAVAAALPASALEDEPETAPAAR